MILFYFCKKYYILQLNNLEVYLYYYHSAIFENIVTQSIGYKISIYFLSHILEFFFL